MQTLHTHPKCKVEGEDGSTEINGIAYQAITKKKKNVHNISLMKANEIGTCDSQLWDGPTDRINESKEERELIDSHRQVNRQTGES